MILPRTLLSRNLPSVSRHTWHPLKRASTPLLPSPTRSYAEGSLGSMRPGGEAASDTWTRREQAAENFYIRQREQSILTMLREKIATQEAILEEDRAILARMEDQYGRVVEGGEK